MRDIVKAIKIETEYIKSNKEIALIDMISEFGYDNLNDYFHDKVKYQLNNLNIDIQYDLMEPTIDKLYECFNNGVASAFSVRDPDRTWIWAGKDNQQLNLDRANELGFGIRNFSYFGGPIITCNEDFNLALIIPNEIDLDVQLVLNVVIDFLASKNIIVTQDNNDLLLDGKKILGSIVTKNDNMTLIAFELSLTDMSSLVKELSLKESNKEPGFISGIKREELEEVFDKWLHTI